MHQLAKSMAQIAMDGGLNGTTPFEPGCCAGALVSGELLHKDGDRLGGHIDDVINEMSQPIVSVGLGCGAIFLVGGTTRDKEPRTLRLRNGDAVILAGAARCYFHLAPRVIAREGGDEHDPGAGGDSEGGAEHLRDTTTVCLARL
jgi:hypothetical protein